MYSYTYKKNILYSSLISIFYITIWEIIIVIFIEIIISVIYQSYYENTHSPILTHNATQQSGLKLSYFQWYLNIVIKSHLTLNIAPQVHSRSILVV